MKRYLILVGSACILTSCYMPGKFLGPVRFTLSDGSHAECLKYQQYGGDKTWVECPYTDNMGPTLHWPN